jgi:hypothetical protein
MHRVSCTIDGGCYYNMTVFMTPRHVRLSPTHPTCDLYVVKRAKRSYGSCAYHGVISGSRRRRRISELQPSHAAPDSVIRLGRRSRLRLSSAEQPRDMVSDDPCAVQTPQSPHTTNNRPE